MIIITVIAIPSVVFGQLKADFIFDKSEGCGSLAVTFTDQSTTTSGTINDWYWDMGGVISTRQNPGSIFTKSGEYTICLTVKTSTGLTSKICKEKVIKVYENPIADFDVNAQTGCIPVNAVFKDKSSTKNGNITSWVWDIGGSANIITTPLSSTPITTTYSSPANYSATLSIVDTKGCKSTTTKRNLIDVVGLTAPSLDYALMSSCNLPWDVQFKNLKVDSLIKYHWDFGNGVTFDGIQPPLVKYTQSGNFTVSLITQKGPCRDTVRYPNLIKTNRITDFDVNNQGLCTDQKITFKDISNYASDSLIWDFGDGTFSKSNNPEKIYQASGCYNVKLKKYIGSCVQEITKPCINVTAKPKINFTVSNGLSCLLPATVKFNASADISGKFVWKLSGSGQNDILLEGDTASFVINEYKNFKAIYQFTGNNGCIVQSDSQNIEVKPFKIDMPALGPEGCVPYGANINTGITSTSPVMSWQWQVGNPALFSSSAANPVFQVNQEGRYDIKLVATNDFGCKDSIIKTNYIRGGKPPIVDFIATPLKGCISDVRKFTALTSNNTDFWTWNVGENTFFSNEKNPEYTLPDIGAFDITLIATSNGCKSLLRKPQYIEAFKPKSAFEVKYNCENPNTIQIANMSVGADSLYWIVKLSETKQDTIRDSLLSSYTFPGRGLYFLSHYAKSIETGCEHTKTDSIFIVDLKASYTLDTIRGCAPLSIKVHTLIQDAKDIKFLDGRYEITGDSNNITAIFRESGFIEGPKLLVTDRHGCVDSFQTSTPVQVSKITAQIQSQNVFCAPDESKFLDISTISNVPIVEKKWTFSYKNQSSSADSAIFNIDTAGTYTVSLKLRDQWGCFDSISKEIKAVDLIPAFSADTLSCTQKAVQFKIDSDPAFLDKFIWTFGDGSTTTDKNPLHYFNNEGKYNICAELFDTRGCSKKLCKPAYVEIKNPKADFSGTPLSAPCPPLLSDFKNLSINASQFTWDFGDNSGLSYNSNPGHLYTNPGTFDLTLMAELIPGCVDTLKKVKYVNLSGPIATMQADILGNCTPLDIRLSANSDKPYEYIWDFGDGKIQKVTGLVDKDKTDYAYIAPGSFIPKLLVSDDKGCSRTFTLDPIKVSQLKPDFISSSVPLCGLPVQLSVENKTISTSTEVSYLWKAIGIKEYVNHDEKPVFLIDAYGKYNISLLAKAPNCIDSIQRDSIVEVAAFPSLDFEFTDSVQCQNVRLNVTNQSNIQYGSVSEWQWSTSNGQKSDQKNPIIFSDKQGSFSVKLHAVSDRGCKDSITKSTTLLPNTLITLPDDKTICIGDDIDLVVDIASPQNFTRLWKNHLDIKCDTCKIVNVKPVTTTTYYVSTTSENGCTNLDSVKVQVINIPGPTLNLSNDTIVCTSSTATISILNFNPAYAYFWDKNAKGLDCYENCQSVKAIPLTDTTYYKVLVKNSYGCFKEDSVKVSIETSVPDFLIENKIICEKNAVKLSVTGGNDPLWRTDPTLQCINCAETIAIPDKSKYYYATITSDNKCKYTDSIYVRLMTREDISAGHDTTVCKGELFTLNGNGSGKTVWISGANIIDSTTLVTKATAQSSGHYVLRTINDECNLTDSIYVTVITNNEIQAIGDTICPGETAKTIVTGNSHQYLWTENGKEMGKGNFLEFQPDHSTKLRVIGTRATCIPDTAEVIVLVYPKIEYEITNNEYKLYLNTKEQVKATYNVSKNYNYIWTPSLGLSCTDCPQPYLSGISQPTDYAVVIKDEYGCTKNQNIFANLKEQCVGEGFYIPNIFTPYKKDGRNDDFYVVAEDEAEFISISIYDRWGEKVWSTDDINASWDGLYKGRQLNLGVYTYIVTAKCDKTNNIFNFAGDVTILD